MKSRALVLCLNTPYLTTHRPFSPRLAASFRLQRLQSARISTAITRLVNMRAILIKDGTGPAENLYIGEEATPTPKQGQVLVKIKVGVSTFLQRVY